MSGAVDVTEIIYERREPDAGATFQYLDWRPRLRARNDDEAWLMKRRQRARRRRRRRTLISPAPRSEHRRRPTRCVMSAECDVLSARTSDAEA